MKLKLAIPKDRRQAELSEQRRQAYPPLTDLADALYWQSKGDDALMKAYLAKIEAVKARFPKVEK